jgi:hypothetical protein
MNNLSEHAIEKYIPCMNSGKEYKELNEYGSISSN